MAFPTGWTRKCKLTIQNSLVSATLTDFPVLITKDTLPSEIFDADGTYPAQNGGGDLRFSSDSAGVTQLPCEVVGFVTDNDPANGTAEIWVKIPSVSSSVDTDFYVWYNTSGSDTQPAVTDTYGRNAVWSDYDSVHHFQESATPYTDSTGNGFTLSDIAGTSGDVAGAFGGSGVDLSTSGDSIEYGGAGLPTGDVTLSAWIKQPTLAAFKTILGLRYNTANQFRTMSVGPAANSYPNRVERRAGGALQVEDGPTLTADTWSLFHGVIQSTDLEAFRDAATDGSTTVASAVPTAPNRLFSTPGGMLDEARVYSSFVPTADWITAEYNNQSSPSTFLIEGTPEDVSAGGDTDVIGIIDTLVLTEGSATVSHDINVTGILDALALAEGTATVSLDSNILGITSSLSITEGTASIAADTSVLGITQALVLTEGTATLSADTDVLGITDSLTIATGTAAVALDIDIACTTDALSLVEGAASIAADTSVLAITEALTLAEGTATVSYDINVTGTTTALTLAENLALISLASGIATTTDELTLAAGTATVSLDVAITGITAALTLAEATALVSLGVNVTGISQSLALAEGTASVTLDVEVTGTTAALALAEGTATIDTGAVDVDVLGITHELTLATGSAAILSDVTIYAIRKRLTLTGGRALVALSTIPIPATSNSAININLGNVPQIDDPQVYEAVLQVHSAIEAILEYLNAQ